MLRGILALNRDFLTATKIAAKVGRTLAVIGGLVALFWIESWTLALISAFVYVGAGSEIRMAQMRAYQRKMAEDLFGGAPESPFGPGAPRAWGWPPSQAPGAQGPAESAPEDWSKPQPNRPRDVVVIRGGKAKIISRKDPDKK